VLLNDQRINQLHVKVMVFWVVMPYSGYRTFTSPWRWMQHSVPKFCFYMLHSVTTQKTAVKLSNLRTPC